MASAGGLEIKLGGGDEHGIANRFGIKPAHRSCRQYNVLPGSVVGFDARLGPLES